MISEVWPAAAHDLPALVDMGARFHKAGNLAGEYDGAQFAEFCQALIDGDDSVIYRSDAGMIGAHIGTLPWDATYKVAHEFFWWAEDGNGMALLRAYEAWARPRCNEIRMALLTALRPVATSAVLSRAGYQADEMGMVKWQ